MRPQWEVSLSSSLKNRRLERLPRISSFHRHLRQQYAILMRNCYTQIEVGEPWRNFGRSIDRRDTGRCLIKNDLRNEWILIAHRFLMSKSIHIDQYWLKTLGIAVFYLQIPEKSSIFVHLDIIYFTGYLKKFKSFIYQNILHRDSKN